MVVVFPSFVAWQIVVFTALEVVSHPLRLMYIRSVASMHDASQESKIIVQASCNREERNDLL